MELFIVIVYSINVKNRDEWPIYAQFWNLNERK